MSVRAVVAVAILCFAATLISSCGKSDKGRGTAGGGTVKLMGAGASFPAPLYTSWFKKYSLAHDDVQIDYQSVGSGQGVQMFMEGTIDFGASDAAMKPKEIEQVPQGVQLLPMTAGSIVLAYNLEGISDLKLSRQAYTSIFLGEVTKWNDPLIATCNEEVALPDQKIEVIVRADGSGTTFVFTKHLSAISEAFAASPGTNKKPAWPVGVGGKGNEGVTQLITQTPGSIGYVEYGYAFKSKLSMASLENKAGKYVVPTIQSAQAALAGIQMPADLIAWAPDPEGDDSYPIVTYTWLLCYKKYEDPAKTRALKAVMEYCLADGQNDSESLGYIPLPENVVSKVRAAMDSIGGR